jgi:hypothetical protein
MRSTFLVVLSLVCALVGGSAHGIQATPIEPQDLARLRAYSGGTDPFALQERWWSFAKDDFTRVSAPAYVFGERLEDWDGALTNGRRLGWEGLRILPNGYGWGFPPHARNTRHRKPGHPVNGNGNNQEPDEGQPPIHSVPEPGTLALMGSGIGLLALRLFRSSR